MNAPAARRVRERTGKSARLSGVDFDRDNVNTVRDDAAEAEELKLHEEAKKAHEAEEAKKAEETAKEEAKVAAALAQHQEVAKEDPEK